MYQGKALSFDLDENLGDFRVGIPPFARSIREAKSSIANNVELKPDLVNALKYFRSQGARTAVSSGRTSFSIRSAVRYGGIEPTLTGCLTVIH